MEPLTFFAAFVGLISGCHIISSVAKFFGHRPYNARHSAGRYDDWYCFFKPSIFLYRQGISFVRAGKLLNSALTRKRDHYSLPRPVL